MNEQFQLTGRSALVVGGGSGLGEAIAGGLAAAGARVTVADISIESAERVAQKVLQQGGEARSEKLDVTSRAEVEQIVNRVVETWGAVDILVNSAGIAIKEKALDYPEAAWDKIIATNLKGTFLTCQAAGRQMAARRRGKIINIASIGAMIAYPGSIAYLASKGGVAQLTKGFAVELAPFNVQVNAIAPSLFSTPMVQRTRSDSDSLSYFVSRTPAARLGEPEEIVGSAVFLASDASSMVTGHILAVDGGYLSA
jgi:NAD(P)-dependent dehydrogenase (short-subunit alcohol dehydrogenase family)